MKLLISFLLLTQVCFAQTKDSTLIQADLIIYNAQIISGPYTPTYTVMVIRDKKIVALYKNDKWKKEYKSSQIIDMQKKVVLPGFIDAHCHFLGLGKAMDEASLWGSQSWEETVEKVKLFIIAHPERQWIQGRGWDQNNWPGKEFPDNKLLDSLFPNKYIVLSRVDGHAVIASSNVLNYAGVSTNSKIKGGKLLTHKGKLTGVLVDNATQLVENKIPTYTTAQKIKWLLAAQDECLKNGLTQVTDAGLPIADILLIDSLCKAGALKMRFYLMANPEKETWDYLEKNGAIVNEKVKCQSVKIYSDGALGSRGALLKQPYCDDKTNYGLQLIDAIKLDSLLTHIYNKGFQACTHAIGDSANAMVLKAYSKILKTTTNERRWRIEHAQVVDPTDWHYFETYSIIPSVQPTHATSDMHWAESRLCKPRMKGAYCYKSLLASSAFMPLGTDFPVEYVSPFYTIRAARFRQDANGLPKEGYNKKEALSATETFAGMSIWAAMGNFWENETGTLEVGKFADFIVLDKNPYIATLSELNTMEVKEIYIGGTMFRKFFKKHVNPDF
ncbi:MAG: amidohydrolase [Bacteroidia bacterium]